MSDWMTVLNMLFNYQSREITMAYPTHNIRIQLFLAQWLVALCRLLLFWWCALRKWLLKCFALQAVSEHLQPPPRPAFLPWMRGVSRRVVFYRGTH
jgi:hypothetical protein